MGFVEGARACIKEMMNLWLIFANHMLLNIVVA